MVKQRSFLMVIIDNIKDNMHQRYAENTHPIVNFNAETKFVGRKDDFLSRFCNKQGLINLVTVEL